MHIAAENFPSAISVNKGKFTFRTYNKGKFLFLPYISIYINKESSALYICLFAIAREIWGWKFLRGWKFLNPPNALETHNFKIQIVSLVINLKNPIKGMEKYS